MSERPFTKASFSQFLAEGRLMGSRCQSCSRLYVPPRPLRPACHGEELVWVEMEGRGKLVAYTTVHIGPKAMIEEGYDRNNPYCSGIVELLEGPRISARIRDVDAQHPDTIDIGTRVTFQPPDPAEGEGWLAFVTFGPDQPP